MSTAEVIIALLGGGSIAGILGAVINGIFSRRKLGADATEVITKAASGVVERIEQDNERLRKEVETHEERDAYWRGLIAEHTRVLQLHAAWDHMAVQKLREAGITDLPDPPPVYHPKSSPSRTRAFVDGE